MASGTDAIEEEDAILELIKRTSDCQPEADDPGFVLNKQTMRRYLVARDWDVDAAENQLRGTLAWRRETKPQHVVCSACQKKPGCHAMRHVGFDKQGRPVMYFSFSQCSNQYNTSEEALEHVTYLLENAARALHDDVTSFIWVMDFTGMKLTACNPRVGLAVEQVLSAHYPERVGAFIFLNHGLLFHTFWRAVRGFLCERTLAKAVIHRHHARVEQELAHMFDEELKTWLFDEVRENKTWPVPEAQKKFWMSNATGSDVETHDPRGCASYIRDYVDAFDVDDYKSGANKNMYLPHQNILTDLLCDSST